MSNNYIVDNTPYLSASKADLSPFAGNPINALQAAELNNIVKSIVDIRAFEISGAFKALTSSLNSPNPGVSGSSGWSWLSSSLVPQFTTTSSSGLINLPFGGGESLGWFDVRRFGAVGDGVTDDGPAFQRAVNAAMGNIGLSWTGSFAQRAGVVYVPPTAPSSSYYISTPIVFTNTQGGSNGSGPLHFRITGCGADGPIKVAVGPSASLFDFGMSPALEWFQGHVDNLAFVSRNFSHPTLGHADCSSMIKLTAPAGTWNVSNISIIGVWCKQSSIHCSSGGVFNIENIHDNGSLNGFDVSFLAGTGVIFIEQCSVVNIRNIWNYIEFGYLGSDLTSGGALAFVQVDPARAGATFGDTTVSIRGMWCGTSTSYMVNVNPVVGTNKMNSLIVEDFFTEVNTAGIQASYANKVEIRRGVWQASAVRSIVDLFSVNHATIEDVTSTVGFAPKVTFDTACPHIEVINTTLSSVTNSPCGVVLPSATSTAAFITTNGVRARVRQARLSNPTPISSSLLVKFSGSDGQIDLLQTGDDARLAIGISLDNAVSASNSCLRIVEEEGQQVSAFSDGAATIGQGDSITSSGLTAGRIKKTSSSGVSTIGGSLSTVAASVDAPTNFLWSKSVYGPVSGAGSDISCSTLTASLDVLIKRNLNVYGTGTFGGSLTGSDVIFNNLLVTTGSGSFNSGFVSFNTSTVKGGELWLQQTPVSLANTLILSNAVNGQAKIILNDAQPISMGTNTSGLSTQLVLSSDAASVGIGLSNASIAGRLHVSGGLGFRLDGNFSGSRSDSSMGFFGNAIIPRPAAYTINLTGSVTRTFPSGSSATPISSSGGCVGFQTINEFNAFMSDYVQFKLCVKQLMKDLGASATGSAGFGLLQ